MKLLRDIYYVLMSVSTIELKKKPRTNIHKHKIQRRDHILAKILATALPTVEAVEKNVDYYLQ